MPQENSIMKFEPLLPADFDGIFRFTNSSKEDFTAKWANKEYLFPAESTVALVIPEHSPLEIQHIRKKFAKDYAEREFFKSKGYRVYSDQEGKPGNRVMNSIQQAATYTEADLLPYIQSCLQPLKAAMIATKPVPVVPLETKLTRNKDNQLNTEAIDQNTSLRTKALNS